MQRDGISKAESLTERLDELVEPAPEPENEVLVDNVRIVRWAGPAFALFSVIMLPWTAYLAWSLPSRQVSPDYDIAWAGFDVMLMAALAGTAYFAFRRSRYLAVTASGTAAFLLVDAWFDVVTSPGAQRLVAIVLAVAVELPLAAVCGWLSLHTQQLERRRVLLLLRRGGSRRGRRAGRRTAAG